MLLFEYIAILNCKSMFYLINKKADGTIKGFLDSQPSKEMFLLMKDVTKVLLVPIFYLNLKIPSGIGKICSILKGRSYQILEVSLIAPHGLYPRRLRDGPCGLYYAKKQGEWSEWVSRR